MPRPPRNAYPGGLFHAGTRGNSRCRVFLDATDYTVFLMMLDRSERKYNWRIYAWCLMTTHYHLVVSIPDGGLSQGMCELNGSFARWSNLRHEREDHCSANASAAARSSRTSISARPVVTSFSIRSAPACATTQPNGVGAATAPQPATTRLRRTSRSGSCWRSSMSIPGWGRLVSRLHRQGTGVVRTYRCQARVRFRDASRTRFDFDVVVPRSRTATRPSTSRRPGRRGCGRRLAPYRGGSCTRRAGRAS